MKNSISCVSFIALASVLATSAYGQEAPQPVAQVQPEAAQPGDDQPETGGEIVVTATRLRGEVDTDVPPVVELDEAEIAAVGASSLEDLIAQLAPQVGSGRGRGGRPVFLVNGQRVSGFREMRRYPPEAIQKVEVFPEEVALQYGYPADQRVINFILKDNFASREVELELGGPTAGGRLQGEVEASQLTINGPNRLLLGAEYNRSTLLTEDERNIVQTPGSVPTVASDPDPAGFRSLAGSGDTVEIEATWNTGLPAFRSAAMTSALRCVTVYESGGSLPNESIVATNRAVDRKRLVFIKRDMGSPFAHHVVFPRRVYTLPARVFARE